MKDIIKMIAVLGLIAAVSAGLLSAINDFTAPIIEENIEQRRNELLAEVIEADKFEAVMEDEPIDGEEPKEIYSEAFKNGDLVGYVVEVAASGYGTDPINMLVGVNTDYEITGIAILSHAETPGLGDLAFDDEYVKKLEGRDLEQGFGDIDVITGATASSRAVITGARNALEDLTEALGVTDEVVIDLAEIPDGVYEGAGQGYAGEISVSIEVSGGELISVEVLEHTETDGIADPALEQVPSSMVDEQELDVDTVSGATATSEGIIEAVKDALSEFGGEAEVDMDNLEDGTYAGEADGFGGVLEVEVVVEGGEVIDITYTHNDTPDYADDALPTVAQEIKELQSLNVDTSTGATVSSEALVAAVEEALLQASGSATSKDDSDDDAEEVSLNLEEVTLSDIDDGTYTGEGQGFESTITVEVTVQGGEITDLTFDHDDTPNFADEQLPHIVEEIKSEQSLAVDIETGATYSASGLIDAVIDALPLEAN
ncbi:FMN-binding protein [Proteinivorax tanatarense]|uniref:Ion-translocating oxidoreductase complex subunit G n=1 Tax=Proteinivorax tanatarense TaxID=1260629 RepID=A0AAU7VIH2_9FIRM